MKNIIFNEETKDVIAKMVTRELLFLQKKLKSSRKMQRMQLRVAVYMPSPQCETVGRKKFGASVSNSNFTNSRSFRFSVSENLISNIS